MSHTRTARLTRFEMAYRGESEQEGFMFGLDDCGLESEEIEELLSPFSIELATPAYQREWFQDPTHFPAAYFTDAGLRQFKPAIQQIIDAVRYRDNGWDVIKLECAYLTAPDIHYQDNHQVIGKTRRN